MPLSYRWIDASYKYTKKKKPQVTIIIWCILPSDEAQTLSLREIKAWPTCLHMWRSPRAASWEPLSQWLLFLCTNGSRVTLWGVWQPSTGAAGWKKKTKKPQQCQSEGLAEEGLTWGQIPEEPSKCRPYFGNWKKLRNGILSIQVNIFLSTIKMNQSLKIDLHLEFHHVIQFLIFATNRGRRCTVRLQLVAVLY